MRIASLHIYPLKSARGISLQRSACDAFGLRADRRWMLTDPNGKCVTQREMPELAQITARWESNMLVLSKDGQAPLQVSMDEGGERLSVEIWESTVDAALAEASASATLSDWLQHDLKLVHFDDQSRRSASVKWTGTESPVTFADGYQVLITNTASLAALNENMAAHGEAPVGMDRFRPNIVLEHDIAFAEDGWEAVKIGSMLFRLVKPCTRCIMTSQDQQIGSREIANPMPAMGRIRMSADRRVPGVLFGWNAVPVGSGEIAVGESFEIVGERDAWPLKRRT
ncbi:MOSC domain-containing protein [Rhizobium helianthi]|uniref:MOSC domain-containing protein n=1 Tax=Rhizobium helianthi TaxID=1132695 RepID=A0ABW4M6D2_9HYPH